MTDLCLSCVPMILGHAHPDVVKAVCDAAADGTSFGAPPERESRLARLVVEAFPSIELLRMVSSGTEAGRSVLRAARGFTGRDVIVKFEGCYHGHSDGLLVKAGSGALTLGVPDSAGVPAAYAGLTLTLPFNDVPAVEAVFADHELLVTPSLTRPAIAADHFAWDPVEVNGVTYESPRHDWYPYPHPFNHTGHPALALPSGWTTSNMPVGLQIAAPWHAEDRLIRAGAELEAARPWSDRRPPVLG